MVAFPNCKINIGLHVINKRTDGFHNIETIFYPVGVKDALEIIEDPTLQDGISYSQTGSKIPGDGQDNLCVKAYHLMKADFPSLPKLHIHLLKAIPVGAGLGGGSADASFTLQLLNKKLKLGLTDEALIKYALQAGSDCPFFIINKPCYATGRGEMLEAIPLDISSHKILLVNPGIHINTGWAFSNIEIKTKTTSLKELIALPIKTWQQNIVNDFEKPVCKEHAEIAEIKADLINEGALYAAMSGSGSTVFGIFDKEANPSIKFPAHYFQKWV